MGCFASKPVDKDGVPQIFLVGFLISKVTRPFRQLCNVYSRAASTQAAAACSAQATSEPASATKPPLPDSYNSQQKVFSLVEHQDLKGSTIDDSAHEDTPACDTQAMLLLTLPLGEAVTDLNTHLVGNLTGASLNLTLSCEEDSQKELSIDFR